MVNHAVCAAIMTLAQELARLTNSSAPQGTPHAHKTLRCDIQYSRVNVDIDPEDAGFGEDVYRPSGKNDDYAPVQYVLGMPRVQKG